MYFKCNYCDPSVKRGEKPIKTIDTDKHCFIKDEKKKYYHLECYETHLRKRKKLTEDQIQEKVQERLAIQEDEMKELESKNLFLDWIMDFYDGTLPSFFLKKLSTVRNGTYEGLNEEITYETLLDIYQYMANYLKKRAMQMNFKNTVGNMNYDLAVVVGKYGDYKRFKAKQHANVVTKNEIQRQIKVDEKIKIASQREKIDDFDITDHIEDLLL